MNIEEYKRLLLEKDVLDHTTLHVTLKELAPKQEFELAAVIKRILENSQIPKPLLHADPYRTSTTYYKVDLSAENVNKIIDIFGALETAYVGQDGKATPTASFYATLADKWNKLT